MNRKLIAILSIPVFLIISYVVVKNVDSGPKLPSKVDYNFHIRPILSDKCFACHGPDEAKRESGLRLDTEEGAYAALKEAPGKFGIVPGSPDESELIHRIFTEDSSMLMPPPEFKLALTHREKELLRKWIEQGAEYKPHWAFVAPEMPEVPVVSGNWAQNEIDHFILARMEEADLTPNDQSEAEFLLKRVSFDLTGLPPTQEQMARYAEGFSDEDYEQLVDELLASAAFGEKMAIHWMDVARYADSHGYQDDGLRTMWPWRDWVIHAFNNNYPYDKFVKMQLAGDLLPNKTKESILATGFNRNHKITQEGGVIDEEYRVEYVTDRTNTFGKAFLGLTFECAKCHDHKYDPISMRDYYGTFAFFDKVPEKGLYGTIDASFADPPSMKISYDDAQKELPFVNLTDTMGVEVMIMQDSAGLRDTYILERGSYDRKGEVVSHSTPEAILKFDTTKFQSDRLGLSDWLFDESNPLTARVYVNRLWQELFGKGLVGTSGDFGMQGDFPTHPQLLDYLALEFRNSGWNIKALVKKIVMSQTYKQSGKIDKEKADTDPENFYYSYYKRTRLSAEEIRDHILSSSGLLHHELGGPSMKPYQPDGIWESATSGRGLLQSYQQDHGKDLYRRGLYTFIKRTVPPPSMLIFDASNRDQCEVTRLNTNTPLQSLVMLNDPTVLEASRVMAERIIEGGADLNQSLQEAFSKIICRTPSAAELKVLEDYYKEVYTTFQESPESAERFVDVGEFEAGEINLPALEKAAIMQIIHTLYNMEEAITKS